MGKYKVKIDGQEKEVDLTDEQIVESYQKAQHFTKATQEVSEKEKAILEKEKSLQEKEKEIETLKSTKNLIENNPILLKNWNKMISDYQSGKLTEIQVESKADRLIDKYIDEAATPEAKESLRDVKKIFEDEIGRVKNTQGEELETLKSKIELLTNSLNSIASTTLSVQAERVEKKIDELKAKYGEDIVNKDITTLRDRLTKYPNLKGGMVLMDLVGEDRLGEALFKQVEQRKVDELERKKKGSINSGYDGLDSEKITPKLNKAGVADMSDLLSKVKEKFFKSKNN